MGRTVPTATLRVYQFESAWKKFARAPRTVDREAFAELVAFAHYHAAAIAHAASPYPFEMILLAMLVGLVQRVETLEAQGIMEFSSDVPQVSDLTTSIQTTLRVVMTALRQRLWKQQHELYTFAWALRKEDQTALRALLVATQGHGTLTLEVSGLPSDEMLLSSLVELMRSIRRLEKQATRENTILTVDAWSRACGM